MPKALETAKKTIGAVTEALHAVVGLVSWQKTTDDADTDSTPRRGTNTYAEALRKLAKEKKNAPIDFDPAHAPGHRHLKPDDSSSHVGGKVHPQNDSVVNNNAKADRIHQSGGPQRRG